MRTYAVLSSQNQIKNLSLPDSFLANCSSEHALNLMRTYLRIYKALFPQSCFIANFCNFTQKGQPISSTLCADADVMWPYHIIFCVRAIAIRDSPTSTQPPEIDKATHSLEGGYDLSASSVYSEIGRLLKKIEMLYIACLHAECVNLQYSRSRINQSGCPEGCYVR